MENTKKKKTHFIAKEEENEKINEDKRKSFSITAHKRNYLI